MFTRVSSSHHLLQTRVFWFGLVELTSPWSDLYKESDWLCPDKFWSGFLPQKSLKLPLEVQDQTKLLVFRMIHGARIPDPTKGQAVWSAWTSWASTVFLGVCFPHFWRLNKSFVFFFLGGGGVMVFKHFLICHSYLGPQKMGKWSDVTNMLVLGGWFNHPT